MNPLAQLRSLFEPILNQLAPDKAKVAGLSRHHSTSAEPRARRLPGQLRHAAGQGYSAGSRRKSPRRSSPHCPPNDLLEPPQVAGPGFINLRLKNDWLATQVRQHGRRRTARRRAGGEAARTSSSTTAARTSPSRCTSAICAARSSATRSRACCASSATRSSPTITSATGARSSGC